MLNLYDIFQKRDKKKTHILPFKRDTMQAKIYLVHKKNYRQDGTLT